MYKCILDWQYWIFYMSKSTPCDQKTKQNKITHPCKFKTDFWLTHYWKKASYLITKRNLPCVDISALPHRHLQQQNISYKQNLSKCFLLLALYEPGTRRLLFVYQKKKAKISSFNFIQLYSKSTSNDLILHALVHYLHPF